MKNLFQFLIGKVQPGAVGLVTTMAVGSFNSSQVRYNGNLCCHSRKYGNRVDWVSIPHR